jgi:amino acid permease
VGVGHCDLVLGFRYALLQGETLSHVEWRLSSAEAVDGFGLTLSIILRVFGVIRNGMTPGRIWRDMSFQSGSCGFADAWVITTCAYDGSDDIATTSGGAGETRNCLKPTIYAVVIVLLVVYAPNNTFIGLRLEPTDHELGVMSPFTLVVRQVAIGVASDIVTAVVIIAMCCMLLRYPYHRGRMTRELAAAGGALRALATLISWVVPVTTLAVTMVASAIVPTVSLWSEGTFACAFELSGVLTWQLGRSSASICFYSEQQTEA